jgi:hypothetical protein
MVIFISLFVASSILVVALLIVSLDFMQEEKYIHFIN